MLPAGSRPRAFTAGKRRGDAVALRSGAMTRARRVLIVLLVMPALFGLAACGPRPPDVDRTLVVGGLDAPTAFRFLPDGRVLIAEQAGTIEILHDGVLHPAPLVTIPV